MLKWVGNNIKWFIPIVLLLLVELFKTQPVLVENWYAQGVYPIIGIGLRKLFGRIPISIGDLMVTILIIYAIIALVKFFLGNGKQKWKKLFQKQVLGKLVRGVIWIYILFHGFWGFNYYRLGSAYLLNLEPKDYTTAQVDSLMSQLQSRLQQLTVDSIGIEQAKSGERTYLSNEAIKAFGHATNRFPFLAFKNQSLKPILLGRLQAYAGYAGYLFPFTGEAQADFYVPDFTLPFTVCHEMAHQLGFGTESEANMVGFLAARESQNKAFVYSAYAGVHQYALMELYNRDSLKAKSYIKSLPAMLKKDRMIQRQFAKEHESFLQPVLDAAYTLYLKGNNQPQGLESYNRVVAWLIAYGKKYGWQAI